MPRSVTVPRLAIRDAYAYWVTALDTETDSSLVRILKDGSSSVVETISDDVRHSLNHDFDITTDATSIYWTDNLLSGSIQSCPLTGCSGASEVVLTPLRAPQSLLIDGSELYYVHETAAYEYALSSCSLPACAPSEPLLEHLTAPDMVAMDDQYLYTASTEQDTSPNSVELNVAKIRRLPKPVRSSP